MYEDEPQDRVHDVLAEAVYGDHPLGRRVLGERRGDRRRSRATEIAAYHRGRYTAPNLVVARRRPPRARRDRRRSPASTCSPAAGEPNGARRGASAEAEPRGSLLRRRRPSSTTSASAARGSPRGDDRRFALGVLDTIFGGSTSSRLFREIREKRGLAYAVGSYTEQYVDRGMVAMYVGTREDNVAEACEIIGRELGRPARRGRRRDDELVRAKEHVKGRMVLALESSGARMSRIARGADVRHPAARPRRDARAGRRRHRRGPRRAGRASSTSPAAFSAACIGPDEDCFREAAGAVGPALARGLATMIRVAVSGAAGSMGETVCEAVEGADDMELVAPRRPGARRLARRGRSSGADVVVDFTHPRRRRRQRASRRSPPASTPSSAPPASTSTSCASGSRRSAPAAPTASSRPTSRSAPC